MCRALDEQGVIDPNNLENADFAGEYNPNNSGFGDKYKPNRRPEEL